MHNKICDITRIVPRFPINRPPVGSLENESFIPHLRNTCALCVYIYIYSTYLNPIIPPVNTYRGECHYLVTPTYLRFVPTWNPLPSPERSCIVNAAYVNKVGIYAIPGKVVEWNARMVNIYGVNGMNCTIEQAYVILTDRTQL